MTIVTLALVLLGQGMTVHANGRPHPELVGDMAAIFGPENYPPAAIRAHEEGRVVADLTVDPQGRVTDCKIIQSASASLDERTCQLAMSGSGLFRATKDRRGNAIASHYRLPIRWRLPDGGGNPREVPHSTATISEMIVDADGKPSECKVRVLPADTVVAGIPCPESTAGLQMAVMQRSGHPKPLRFRYLAYMNRIFGDGPMLTGDMPKDMTVLQRYRVDFTVDPSGKAVDCRWSVGTGPVDTDHMPTRCQGDEPFAMEPNMPKSGYDQVQIAYEILPPRP